MGAVKRWSETTDNSPIRQGGGDCDQILLNTRICISCGLSANKFLTPPFAGDAINGYHWTAGQMENGAPPPDTRLLYHSPQKNSSMVSFVPMAIFLMQNKTYPFDLILYRFDRG